MSLHWKYQENDGSIGDITGRVRWADANGGSGWQVSSQADEGAVGSCDVQVDDPDAAFNVRGHRLVYAVEDEALADDYGGVIGVWYTAQRRIERKAERTGSRRTWTVSLVDVNSLLDRRLMEGSTKRPAETDIERITWLLAQTEMRPVENDTTYIAGSGGVAMDKDDYVGQSVRDIIDDCAQQSGRTYFVFWQYSGDPTSPISLYLWYHQAASSTYTSSLSISNALADIDGVATFAPAMESVLTRDPSQVYAGVDQAYDGGHAYVQKLSTARHFTHRDTTGRAENVKTKAKAIARANRYLNTIDTELDIIETAIEVPAAQVNGVMAGHRMAVRFTHEPGYNGDPVYMRVVERTIRPLNPDLYELALTLKGNSQEELAGAATGPAFAILQGSISRSGFITWDCTGDSPDSGFYTLPTVGPFSFNDDPTHPATRFSGLQIDGDGTIDRVEMRATAIGVRDRTKTYTVTWWLLKNGAPIGTYVLIQPADGHGWAGWGNNSLESVIVVENLAVSAGDSLSGMLTCEPVMAFFRSPLGINTPGGLNGNRLLISGGSVA